MKNLKQFLVLIFLALGTTLGLAQQSISGSVSDETGPLPGVTIVEKGTTNGTTADFDGNYSISVSSEDAILVISYLGFVTRNFCKLR
jgi:iron complex outermembrane receptor protein